MSLFVDTSVWSLALRRDGGAEPESPEVHRLREALLAQEAVHTTGLVLQELLQGFRGARAAPPGAASLSRDPNASRSGTPILAA